jgi:predicted glycogen debranching enzyme
MDAKEIKNLYSSELRVREEISSYEAELRRAAKMFFVEKDDKVEVIAGYPWFGRWGRDTFISLPGLCIGLNDMKLFKKAIDTLIGDMNQGLFPNIGSGEQIAYNSVDAPMWFFWAMQQYSDYTGKKKQIWKEYKEVMQSILCSYRDGENHNIRMLDNCLIWAGEDGKALTWMDAVVDGVPVTQRKGMCVEINALWYNAIMFSLELAKDAKDKDFIRDWEEIAERIPTEFKATFWDKNYGWLADYVDGYYKDFTVRPNMVIATSLKYSCLSPKICQLILDRVEKELFTPFGLRTLSPTHKDYHDVYCGNQEQRDRAYHQGTAWTWLLGHFVEGYLKIYGDCALEIAERIYEGFRLHIKDYGVGGIAEIFDGNPPHSSKGSISQAWSVAEVIRIKYMIGKYKQEKEGEKV